MKITILGPAHPYRGGLASIMETMARVFRHRGHEVKIDTFSLQYPRGSFPERARRSTRRLPPTCASSAA